MTERTSEPPPALDHTELAAALVDWLPRRRWFAGKARDLAALTVADEAALAEDVLLVIVEVAYDEGPAERYLVPLADRPSDADRPADTDEVLAGDGHRFVDALDDPEATRLLVHLALSGARVPTAGGGLVLSTSLGPTSVTGAVRRLGVEQSNSSAVLDDRLIIKVLRRLDEGENPEVELTGALTAAGSPHVPALRGWLRWRLGPTEAVLAVVHDFVAGGREGWALATDETAARGAGRVLDAAPLAAGAYALGEAVGGVHAALARELGARRATSMDAQQWTSAAEELLDRVLRVAARRDPEGTRAVRERRAAIEHLLARGAALTELGAVTRVHGDLHLGQVLVGADDGWRILDFEGEPARDLAARRAAASPLRDVAGMLRSIDYAVGHAVLGGAREEELAAWRDQLRSDFLTGWLAVAGRERLAPEDRDVTATLLAFLELEKAVYELGYELGNRPDWVPIPVGGILRILDRDLASTPNHADPHADADPDAEEPAVARPTTAPTPSTPVAVDAPVPDLAATREGIDAVVAGTHADPHRVLGLHEHADGALVRAYRPEADDVEVRHRDGTAVAAERVHEGGVFEAVLPRPWNPGDYRLHVTYGDQAFDVADAFAFWPTLGEVDLHLAGEGRHEELWRRLGAHLTENDGVTGTSFAVWAPNARSVRVVGDFNSWDGRLDPMRKLPGGIWELFLPDVRSGALYQYELLTATGETINKADPFAFATEVPPGRASKVFHSEHVWGDDAWRTADRDPLHQPMSVYEIHLGSWRHRDGRPLSYRELADDLVGHVTYCGFTHVEMLPPAEHPFGGSWGYQVTGYYAPTARFGTPDDFRYLVDRLHQAGIGVIVDWVPAHFPKDEWALARFDGTALYEHADPRQGEHPDWGTLVFNFGRNEVRNFLVANALYWLEELHVDGLRVDAVASMLYLDYSREEGQWVPNAFGGRENLEAVEFLKELNTIVYGRNPHALVIAEESTAWPGVSRPVHLGGLGFGFKWNMGWMHDSLDYVQHEPVHRRYHHHQLTFALMYAFSENFVLPFSHDEVVHGKGSMIAKMPGNRWQRFASLRALYGYMWAHPGKQLIFMGSEFGQWREWSEERELDWWLTDEADHRGLQALVAEANRVYRATPALWEADEVAEGFQWIDANDADGNVFSFLRWSRDGRPLVCITNFSDVVRRQRVGLPSAGRWDEVLNSDAEAWGGSNVGNYGGVDAAEPGWHGLEASTEVTLPPLATVWLRPAA